MLRPFRSGYLLSEALVVSGGEIYLPLIIINYMLVWMERKKKTVNGNWYTNAWIAWPLCSGWYILHVSWALCTEHISVRNSYVEEGYFFLFSLSDLLLPVNSCECVAQDFLSICKSKKFFFSPFFLLSLLPILSHFVKEWEWENGRWKTFSAAGVNLKEPV